jgi:hypothetical protein
MDQESTVIQQAMKGNNQQKSGSLEEFEIRKCRNCFIIQTTCYMVKL